MVVGFSVARVDVSLVQTKKDARENISGSILEYRTLAILDTLRDIQLYTSQIFADICSVRHVSTFRQTLWTLMITCKMYFHRYTGTLA